MNETWICYLDNQEFGPISRQELLELIQEGTVPRGTYIRRPTDTSWSTIEQVFGNVPLRSALPEPQPATAPSAESRMFSDSPTMVNAPSLTTFEAFEEGWYWHSLGETFGPVPLENLVGMAERGQLLADDYIRMGDKGEWTKAGTVEALFPSSRSFVDGPNLRASTPPPATPAIPPPAVPSAAVLSDETKLLQQLLELLQQNPNVSQLMGKPPEQQHEQQWYCMVSGQQIGPLSIEALVQMVLQGRVFPDDMIRLGTSGDWFPASTVEDLFPRESPSAVRPPMNSAAPADAPGKVDSNARKVPESELVMRGLERLFKASEEATKELAEKEKKLAKENAGKDVSLIPKVNDAQKLQASRAAAGDIIQELQSVRPRGSGHREEIGQLQVSHSDAQGRPQTDGYGDWWPHLPYLLDVAQRPPRLPDNRPRGWPWAFTLSPPRERAG
ncbi:MAG: DUF4339 domain-containing protein [Planctomycetales bacterium]